MRKKRSGNLSAKTKAKTVDLIRIKYMGSEPKQIGSNLTENDSRIIRAFGWYNYTYSVEELRPAILEYMAARNFSKSDIQAVKSASDDEIGITSCSIAQILLNDNILPDRFVNRLNDTINKAIKKYQKKEVEDHTRSTVSIQQRIKNLASDVIGDIDYIIDMCEDDETVDAYQFLSDRNISGKVAVHIKEYYEPELEEFNQALRKKDLDLIEGYSSYTKDQLKQKVLRLQNIISDVDRIVSNKVKVRKPRKARAKKIKTASQLTTKVKYQPRFDQLKLVSISPEQIIGAQVLYTYNTKYKVLNRYQAIDKGGLNIKGTTVLGFDEKLSVGKKLRKPEPVLNDVLNGGKVTLRHLIDKIKAKSKSSNGRLNNTTILLRVLK